MKQEERERGTKCEKKNIPHQDSLEELLPLIEVFTAASGAKHEALHVTCPQRDVFHSFLPLISGEKLMFAGGEFRGLPQAQESVSPFKAASAHTEPPIEPQAI